MKSLIYFLLSVFILASCNSSGDNAQTSTDSDTTAQADAPEIKTEGAGTIDKVLSAYFALKNALTQDDSEAAASAAKNAVTAFRSFNTSVLTEAQKKTYTEVVESANEHAEHISTNSGNLKHQREHFEFLSTDIHDLVKSVGTKQKLYVDHCPMYNNNKGANWISEVKEIKNPYLGKEMLECGTVKEEVN